MNARFKVELANSVKAKPVALLAVVHERVLKSVLGSRSPILLIRPGMW